MKVIAVLMMLVFVQCAHARIPCPDFKTSMLLKSEDEITRKNSELFDSLDSKYVGLFQEMYEQIIQTANADCSETYRIPRIVHQIWLGSPLPERYRSWMQSWTSLQGWEYRLWTDEEVEQLFLHNRELYDSVSNYGEKADILRLEILAQFGGVYADIDYECLQPEMFEEFHKKFDFYIGFEPLDHDIIHKFRLFKVCNAILASTANHPLIHDLIINMRANYYAYLHANVIHRTGPSYLTRIICQHEMRGAHRKRNAYLPSSFLYPICYRDRMHYQGNPKEILQLFPEAAGIHFWEGSWTHNGKAYDKGNLR